MRVVNDFAGEGVVVELLLHIFVVSPDVAQPAGMTVEHRVWTTCLGGLIVFYMVL